MVTNAAAATAPTALDVDAERENLPQTRMIGVEELIRIRASLDEETSTVIEWKGQVLSYKPGEAPAVVFNVRGMNIARAKRIEDGGFDLLGRELQLYLDPRTDEVLHTWHNPYSDKDVTVVHVANNPVYQRFPPSMQVPAQLQPGGSYTLQITIPLAYPNPLNPSADTASPTYAFSGPHQAKYTAIESFTFTFPASELGPPTSASSLPSSPPAPSVPSTQVYWTRTSPLLPFMATPDTHTSLLFVAHGHKVARGWRGLSDALRRTIEERVPAYKDAPRERASPGGGVTSWSYFARPEVLEAYKAGREFPLPDPLPE